MESVTESTRFATTTWDLMRAVRLANNVGLKITLLENGLLGSIEHGNILINQVRGVPPEGAPFRLWARADGRLLPLLSPLHSISFAGVTGWKALWSGSESGWVWRVLLELDLNNTAWTWQVELQNVGTTESLVSLAIAQDLGLAALAAVRNNEAYTSHYIDYTIARHPERGPVVFARQNLPQPEGKHPWIVAWMPTGAAQWATDGLDVFGLEQRDPGRPAFSLGADLPSARRQGESACLALASPLMRARPFEPVVAQFRFIYQPNHPEPSQQKDVALCGRVLVSAWPPPSGNAAVPSIWDECRPLHGDAPDAAWWTRRFPERTLEDRKNGTVRSFFTPDGAHVIGRDKDAVVERAHGHILLASDAILPEENALGVTVYMPGVFGVQLYAGNPQLYRLWPPLRDALHRLRAPGLRFWIRRNGDWRLLGSPTAFVIRLDSAEWWYQLGPHLLRVTARAETRPSRLSWGAEVLEGDPIEWRITQQLCGGPGELEYSLNVEIGEGCGIVRLKPHPQSPEGKHFPDRMYEMRLTADGAPVDWADDRLVWADRVSRGAPFLCAETPPARDVALAVYLSPSIEKEASHPAVRRPWRITGESDQWAPLDGILPWFRHDAWIHCASPHGLEQYGGGAWGVRDVCQGPVEWLLSEQRYEEVRQILRIVFANQYADTGLWPQWFMLGRAADIRQRHCHGDIFIWPLKALCDYAEAADDPAFVNERVPYYEARRGDEAVPILEHVRRAIAYYKANCVEGTALVAYGDGDWDDTLQPARAEMRANMVSAWTVALAYQTFGQLAELFRRIGEDCAAGELDGLRESIYEDFHRHLMPDGIVAGFGIRRNGHFSPLVHPRDDESGLRFRLLPMTRGIISGIFTAEEARRHWALIREHLRFPDGVRLMDKPVRYTGGTMKLFQRAETAAYFGREVSLQYVHAHLRYAEAAAVLGDAGELWWALSVVNPIRLPLRVLNAAPRQENVYFSSSDGDFPDRYAAEAGFERLRDGRVAVKGGWRLYSSGPGLFLHKVRAMLFGIRERYDKVIFDPVVPGAQSPCRLAFEHEHHSVELEVRRGPQFACFINDRALSGSRHANPYREAGIAIDRRAYRSALKEVGNRIRIESPQP